MNQHSTQHFIATIEADRDQRIGEIRAETDARIRQILSEAHERSRQLQHDTNRRLRRELSNRRQKETSRIQAHLRRQLWQSLGQLQADITEQVLEKLQAAWSEVSWQQNWCDFWLRTAASKEQSDSLRIDIDVAVLPETLDHIRQWAKGDGRKLELNPVLREPGLVIYWQDFELDGRLSAQGQTIREAVLAQLAAWMPQLQQVDSL